MWDKAQLILTALVPSILVILSWIHNNTRLNRLEVGLDTTNRKLDRMDDLVRGFHSDMMNFQASMLEASFQVRDRLAAVESKQL